VRTKIGLGLDNPPRQRSAGMPVNEQLTEQLLGNVNGRLLVK